jgi:SAM-dependent methyltransferase
MLPVSAAADRISEAVGGGRWLRGYVRGKLRSDPVFEAGRAAVEQSGGPVVDLGCGLGLFGLWLRQHGCGVAYRGCDLSGWKIAAGQQAAEQLGYRDFRLEADDLTTFPLEGARVVCAFDVIHYLDDARQLELVRRLAAAARGGSTVLLRTGVRGCGWRSAVTRVEEWWTRACGWIRGGQINFPRLEDLRTAFEAAGCRVEARPLWGRTLFSSHWLEIGARDQLPLAVRPSED